MKKKLKIGIFLNNKAKLCDGQIRIISKLINSNFIDLKYVFKYEQEEKINLISNILYKFIKKIEKKYLLIKRKKELKFIIKKISKTQSFFFNKNNKDVFLKNKKNIKNLKKIDLLLFFEKNEITKSKIVNYPKQGSWTLNFGVNDFIYTGFWESLLKNEVTKVELQKIFTINSKNNFSIVDHGFYSTKISSWFLNRDFVLEKAAILVEKNIKLLFLNHKRKKIKNKFNKTRKNPSFVSFITYIIIKYPNAFIRKIFIKIFYLSKNLKRPEPDFNPWNIHIGNKNGNKLEPFKDSIRIKPNDDEAWADPFLISNNKNDYLFFENFEFKKQKGKISYTRILNNKSTKVFDALNLKHHLSYPYIWKEKKNFFMMPETGEKKCVEIWKAKKFPKNWFLYKRLFVGQSCVDTTFLDIKNGDRWIFTNKSDDKYNDHNSELYLFKTDKKFTRIIPHKLNPVITDSRIARNAGNIFYDDKNRIIRPSQINILNFYGKGLNLRIIKKLNINEYKEITLKSFFPNFKKGINAIHHISQNKRKYAIDVRYEKILNTFIPQ